MNFKCDNEVNLSGTSLCNYFTTSYKKLENKFGEPTNGDEYKVSSEWVFISEYEDVVTIYDYKETKLYDRDYESVKKFRSRPTYNWHIGAQSKAVAECFIIWLEKQLLGAV